MNSRPLDLLRNTQNVDSLVDPGGRLNDPARHGSKGTFEACPTGRIEVALVKRADEMEQQPEVTHVATQLFPAVVLLAALTTLVPVAAAETGAAPKSIADDYIGGDGQRPVSLRGRESIGSGATASRVGSVPAAEGARVIRCAREAARSTPGGCEHRKGNIPLRYRIGIVRRP